VRIRPSGVICVTQRTMTFLCTCGGTNIVKEFFKHPLPRGTRHHPPRFLDKCKHTCWYAHVSSASAYFWRTTRAAFPSFIPPYFFPLFT